MISLKKVWLGVVLTSLLICSVSGCGSTKPVILRDSEQLFQHPHTTEPGQVCMDEGYLLEIFELLGEK